jgi:pimeloyl-ACP methyl ester carboxylesterase
MGGALGRNGRRLVREFPIFVPFDDDHLAAVVTVPDGPPRGLVVLLQGLGGGRSHRYQLWTRAARALTESGLASIRMDYREMGDSTGSSSGSLNEPPVREILEVIRVGMRATKVSSCAVLGNCMGGRAALRIAQELRGCLAVGVIITDNPQNYVGRGREAALRVSKPRRFVRKVRRRISSRRRSPERRERAPMRWIPEIPATLGVKPLLLLYVGPAKFARPLKGDAAALVRERATNPAMVSVQTIEAETLHLDLPLRLQEDLVARVVHWLDRAVPWPRAASLSGKVKASDGAPEEQRGRKRRSA